MPSNSVLAKMAVEIAANTAKFNSAINQSNKKLGVFQSTIISTAKTLVGGFGAYQVLNALKRGISIIADFERQMGKVKAITGATGEEFSRLESNALALGRSTEYTARQIAGLQVEFGRLGFSTKEILNSTKATINLATATGEDLSRSAEIAGSTLRAFNIDARDMGRVVDVITGALNKSGLALDSYADGIKYVAPVAEATNVSIEETSALLGVLADAGIKGSQAGTSLRRIFTLLDKSGKPVVERLKELAAAGITLAGANDEVGLYAQTALLVITKQITKFEELTKALREANGEAERTAEIIRDDLQGDFDRLTSAIEGVILKGGALNPVFREITQDLTNVVSLLNNDAVPAWERYLAIISAPFTGPIPLVKYAEEAANAADLAAKRQEEAAKKADETLTKQAQRALDLYGIDNLKAISEQFSNGQEIYKRALELTTAALKKETDAEIAAINARLAAAEAAKKAAEELKKAIAAAVELQRINIEANKENPLDFSNITDSKFGTQHGFSDKIDQLLSEDTAQAAQDFADKYNEAFQSTVDNTNKFLDDQEKIRQSILNTRQAAAQISGDIGGFFGELAAGTLTAAQAAARGAASIINTLEQITLARMIANQAKFGLPGIIAAAAGFGLVKSLFSRIGRSSSSDGPSSKSLSAAPQFGTIRSGNGEGQRIYGEFEVKGQSLVAVVDNYNRTNSRLRA